MKKIVLPGAANQKLYDVLATGSMYALNMGLFNRIKGAEKNKSEEPKDMMGLGFLDIQGSAECTRFPNIKNNKLITTLVNKHRIRASGHGAFVCWV